MDARARIEELAGEGGFDLVRFAPAETLSGSRAAALESRAAGRLADLHWMTDEWIERATEPESFLAGSEHGCAAGDRRARARPGASRRTGRGGGWRGTRGAATTTACSSRSCGGWRGPCGRSWAERRARQSTTGRCWSGRWRRGRGWAGWGSRRCCWRPASGRGCCWGRLRRRSRSRPTRPCGKSVRERARAASWPAPRARSRRTGACSIRGSASATTRSRAANPSHASCESKLRRLDLRLRRLPRLVPGGVGERRQPPRPRPRYRGRRLPAPGRAAGRLMRRRSASSFRGRAVQRATRDGFLRNVCVALGNVGTPRGRGQRSQCGARGTGRRWCGGTRPGRWARSGGGTAADAEVEGALAARLGVEAGGVGAGGDRGGAGGLCGRARPSS